MSEGIMQVQKQKKKKKGKRWKELVEKGKKIRETKDNTQWELGDVALTVETEYEKKTLVDYADEINIIYSTLKDYKWVSQKFEKVIRMTFSLPWSYFHICAGLPLEEALRLLRLAQVLGWTARQLRDAIKSTPIELPPTPPGKFRTIIVDPPWPIKKIVREERPSQEAELDYRTMMIDQIKNNVGETVKEKAAENCHVYLWTTHKFLPTAFEIFEVWGVNYECLLTWVKPTGMTPFSWMYNTEHVLFGRIGSLTLLKNGVKLSFEAHALARAKHSTKPDQFFEIVRTVSPEPRLEMFARKPHPGFEPWGDEVIKSPTL